MYIKSKKKLTKKREEQVCTRLEFPFSLFLLPCHSLELKSYRWKVKWKKMGSG